MAEIITLKVKVDSVDASSALVRIQNLADKLNAESVNIKVNFADKEALKSAKESAHVFQLAGVTAAEKVAAANEKLWKQMQRDAEKAAKLQEKNYKNTALQNQIESLAKYQKVLPDWAQGINKINEKTSVFGEISDESFAKYSSGAITAEAATIKVAAASKKSNTILAKSIVLWQMLGNAALSAVRRGFSQAFTEMKNVDSELITVAKVTGATNAELKVMEKQAYKTASAYGVSASEYLSSVADFARAGYKDAAESLAELAVKTQLVFDTSQQTANQFLLSVDAAYKYGGSIEKLGRVLDGVNEIENNFATSGEKITEGMGVVSSTAAAAGVGINELAAGIGTITAVTQRSGTEAARALRALFLNIIGDTKTEIEDGVSWTAEEITSLNDVLKKYSKEAYEAAAATGEVVNPMEVVAGLSKAMKDGTLTGQQFMSMVSDIGGKLRTDQLLAIVQNFDMYKDMLKTFADAAGSADGEVARALEGWEAKTNILKNTWTEFISNTIQTDSIKDLLDVITYIISGLGDLGTALTLIGGLILALNFGGIIKTIRNISEAVSAVGGGVMNLIGVIGNYGRIAKTAAQNSTSFANATQALGDAALATSAKTAIATAGITLIAAAIAAVVIAHNNYIKGLNESAEKQANAANAARDNAQSILELYAQYKTAEAGSQAFRSASEGLQAALGNEAEAAENAAAAYRELTREKIQSAVTESFASKTAASKALEAAYSPTQNISSRLNYGDFGLQRQISEIMKTASQTFVNAGGEMFFMPKSGGADDILSYYKAIGTALDTIKKKAEETGDEALLESAGYKTLTKAYEKLTESADRYDSQFREYEKTKAQKQVFDDVSNGAIRSQQAFDAYIEKIKNADGATDEFKETAIEIVNSLLPQFSRETGKQADAFDDVGDSANDVADSVKEATAALQAYQNALNADDRGNVFEGYAKAFKEMANAAESAKYGSAAFQEGIKLFASPEMIASFEGNWRGLFEYIQTGWGAVFYDAENGAWNLKDKFIEAAGGMKDGIAEIRDENGSLIASLEDVGGALKWNIDSYAQFEKLADVLGITKEALAGVFESLAQSDPGWDLSFLGEYKDAVEEIPEQKQTDFDTNATEAQTAVESLSGAVNAVPDGKTITFNVVTNGVIPQLKAKGTKNFEGGAAIVNDEGGDGKHPELIVDKGRAFIAGGGLPTMVNLSRGAKVYTADETKKILKGGGSGDIDIPAFGGGLQYSGGSSSGKGKGSGAKKSIGDDAAKDLLSELKEWVNWYIGHAEKEVQQQTDAIDDQIDELKKQREAQEEANELLEKELAVEEATKNLIAAQTERTVRYYNSATGQWEWMADQRDVLAAQKALDDANKNLSDYKADQEFNAIIDGLEAQKDALKKQLDTFKEEWNNIVDGLEAPVNDITDILGRMRDSGIPGFENAVSGVSSALEGLAAMVSAAQNNIRNYVEQGAEWSKNSVKNAKSAGGGGSGGNGRRNDGSGAGASGKKAASGGGYSNARTASAMQAFDVGGVADKKGLMAKAIDDSEIVIGPELTGKILQPRSNAQYEKLMGVLGLLYDPMAFNSVIKNSPASYGDSNCGNTYINGVQIGSDMLNRPLSEVLQTLRIHTNPLQ